MATFSMTPLRSASGYLVLCMGTYCTVILFYFSVMCKTVSALATLLVVLLDISLFEIQDCFTCITAQTHYVYGTTIFFFVTLIAAVILSISVLKTVRGVCSVSPGQQQLGQLVAPSATTAGPGEPAVVRHF